MNSLFVTPLAFDVAVLIARLFFGFCFIMHGLGKLGLVGPGNIHFNFNNNGYLGDNSIVYSYGGGVDIDLVRHFQAKIDFQGQHWKTGNAITLTPSILLLGITYHIPFRPHVRQSDFYH